MQSKVQKAVAMDEEKLIAYAKRIAEGVEADRELRLRPLLSLSLKRLHVIRKTARAASSPEIRQTYGGAFEWISDNLYILEREYRLAALSLKDIHRLPGITRGQFRGEPYAYYLAHKLCFAVNFRIRREDAELFLRNAQDKCPLSNRELWLFPDMLRLALLSGVYKTSIELLEILGQKRQEENDNKTRLSRLEQLMGNAITSLRQLSDLDFSESFDRVSITEQILNNDPAGVYENMSLESKIYYRNLLSRMARRRDMPEYALAERLVSQASCSLDNRERHVGTALLKQTMQRRAGGRRLYFFLLICLPIVTAAAAGFALSSFWLAALVLLPLFEVFKSLLDYSAARLAPPVFLPRLDLDKLPRNVSALAIISALITSEESACELCGRLERFYYSNGEKGVVYGILADLKESDNEEFNSEEMAVINAARQAVRALNERLGEHFVLFVRGRRYSQTQRRYMGWERKRGAITELVRYLKGEPASFKVSDGPVDEARRCKYIVTLDADTLLTIDSVRELMAVAEHVVNQPEWDAGARRVIHGYGMLQPRMNIDAERAAKTTFATVTAGFSGIDAYSNLSFDLYQDLFGEGIFAGKGLIHVDAFHACLNDMPEGLILSHDLLEGSYLRAGFVSDVVFTDVQPNNSISYHTRLHRWVRGDWQLLRFILFDRRLPLLSKWKMLDNLRRSLTPAALFLCLFLAGLGLLGGRTHGLAAASAALAALFAGYLVSTADALFRQGVSIFHLRYYSKTLPAAASGLLHSLITLLSLPYTAAVNMGAVVRSLWRQLFSRHRLLDWVTAAQVDVKKSGLFAYYLIMWILPLAGAALFIFGSWCGKVLGLCWFFAPYVLYRTGKQRRYPPRPLSKTEKENLMGYAGDMWQYFEDLVNQKSSYLPPDNYQESPLATLAARTSPTNIGLAMVSCLVARDLGFIDTLGLLARVERTVATLEAMPKLEGHLYNWYDTETLQPLYPRYVSTVDSGNLVCCLCALTEGLMEYAPDSKPLCERILALADGMNFAFLYHKEKRLFYIGYDVEKKSLGDGYYDLYMSEARLTSYYAVAKRVVGKRHWFRLGRMMSVRGGHFGLRSWTGTTFEYYMPHLFLPVYENTMAYESLEYAIRRHKERVKREGVPWGISESAYYSFDSLLNYQYKAFGVASLGLKQGLDKELVISPYSTFLALPFDLKSACRNLERMKACGMYGRYGFYEAADYTRERTAGSLAVIRSYMSHHIGMSLLALDNALNENILQKRFMRHREMSAFKELLHEKLPQQVIEYTDHIEHKEKSRYNTRAAGDRMRVDGVTPVNPKAIALSNGSWFTLLSDSGAGFCRWSDKNITRYRKNLTEHPQGVFFIANMGNRYMPLSFAPVYDNRSSYYTEFSQNEAMFYSKRGDAEGRMRVTVHSILPAEVRELKLRNASFKRKEFCLLAYLEPVLVRHRDEYAHPAFSGLFVEAQKREEGCVILSRRRRSEKDRNIFVCAGFAERAESVELDTRREDVLGRLSGTSRLYRAFDSRFGGVREACLDPCCAMRFYGQLAPKEVRTLHFILAAGTSAEEAHRNFLQIKKEGYAQIARKSGSLVHSMLEFCSAREEEIRLSDLLLPYLYFPIKNGKEDADKRNANTRSQREVWKYGISGEYPIIFLRVDESDDAPRALPFLRAFRLLRLKSADVDLVIQFNEGGHYGRPIYTALRDMVRECGCEQYLDQRRGIHLVNTPDEGDIALLTAMSCFYVELRRGYRLSEERFKPFSPVNPDHGLVPEQPFEIICKNSLGGFTKEGFVIQNKTALSSRPPWCQIYANPVFGTLVSDSALGFTYAHNSRENKLTPFKNDAVTDNNGERLYLRFGGRLYDVAAGGLVHFTERYAEYRCKIGGMLILTTVFVPEGETVKIVRVKCIGGEAPQQFSLCYYTEPVLGVDIQTHEKFIRYHTEEETVYMNNPYNHNWRQGVAYLCCTAPRALPGFDRNAFAEGRWSRAEKPSALTCAFLSARAEIESRGEYEVAFLLGYERNQAAAKESVERLRSLDAVDALFKRHMERGPRSSITVKTPDRFLDRLVNVHLPQQILRSRVYARCGFYQCSGAYGFRDQLQDCMSLATLDPSYLRRQIYRGASHQFEEGDVMHWWHRLPGKNTLDMGVRTRCSDDLLWLPLAVCEYIEKSGDKGILEQKARYIKGPPLKPEEQERYFQPEISGQCDDIYGHCLRSFARGFSRGERGLILFGNGDWNDGMNRVGFLGKGETVWGSMFAAWVMERFSGIALLRGDDDTAKRLKAQAAELVAAVEEHAWDGNWYMRGFYDNGEPLGSSQSDECKIDLLPQSFAAITGRYDKRRTAIAMEEARRRLVDKEHGLIRLFAPPFRDTPSDPGYIKGYLAGVRENGGQYTHAAAWYALAQFMSGDADRGYEALRLLNPAEKSLDISGLRVYRVEPYAFAGDVYAAEGAEGRGGWSLYTGSAGWYYRVVVEYMLGIKRCGDTLYLSPSIPTEWDSYSAQLVMRGTQVNLVVQRGNYDCLLVDNKPAVNVPLDGGQHNVLLIIR